jgi:hypothetical protein
MTLMKNAMNKILLFLLLPLTANLSFGQETIYPLQTNPYLLQDVHLPSHKASTFNSLDSTFIYYMDTLDTLPLRDDFSTSKFEPYNANYTDGNVTSYEYALRDAGMAVLHIDSTYCDSTFSRHDTISITTGIPTTFTSYFSTVQSVNISDLCTYPIEYTTLNLYRECYVLIDSVIDGLPDPTQDTIFYEPQYVQDSAHIFYVTVDDSSNLWVDNFACHNYRFAKDPWSLGVATLDGVDENGMPYDFGNPAAYEEADHLTSKHINLSGLSEVFLTFIYQAKGWGNDPDDQDSLLLDFWEPDSNQWYPSGWKTDGTVTPNIWDTAHIAIPLALLDNGFRFRFRNYASTSAALDHWHIDYVRLEDNLTSVVDPFSDLAIAYPINSLLKDYTSVPWDHFQNASPSTKMIDTLFIQAFNSDNDATNYANGNCRVEHETIVQADVTLPNAAVGGGWTGNWEVGTNIYPYANFSTAYAYDNGIDSDPQTIFDIKVNIAAAVSGSNVIPENDTNYYQQKFDNYYSYDDGSAEAAYGLNGSFAKLAYEFEAYELDTLTGILMHFMPFVDDLSSKIFLLTVWEDNAGEPGDIIYQDDFFEAHSPIYNGSKNGFRYYEFYNDAYTVNVPTEPLGRKGVVLTGTKFYVGWEQLDDESLQIGLDWNIDNSDKIWRNTSGTWLQSSFDASLLIRPVFSTGLNYTLEVDDEEGDLIGMYPNPSEGELNFSGTAENFTVSIFDMSGRMVHQSMNEVSLDISHLNSGVYLVDLRDENGSSFFSDKLVKR